jgi:predicted dehydrogenase
VTAAAGSIGVGMLGYAFMGKAHSRAFREAGSLTPPLVPELVSISGRNPELVERARREYGWAEATTDWREQVGDERIGLFDNGGPNDLHAEPTIEAARNGKHVLCEKPLGRTADEALAIWSAAERAGVVHLCGFNYRFVPAVRLARQMLEAGELGELFHFRARYLQSWGIDAAPSWRFEREAAGSGALGDLGAHIVDLGRYLVGEPVAVTAVVRTFVAGHEVDDSFAATVEFAGGVAGTLEASRLARGRINQNTVEVNGSRGSISFDVERLNELEVADGGSFRRVLVTEPEHPFMRFWWPPGHIVGWGDTFTHEVHHLLGAIAGEHDVAPHGATFEDGYRCAEVCDAILRSAESGRRETIEYRAAER